MIETILKTLSTAVFLYTLVLAANFIWKFETTADDNLKLVDVQFCRLID